VRPTRPGRPPLGGTGAPSRKLRYPSGRAGLDARRDDRARDHVGLPDVLGDRPDGGRPATQGVPGNVIDVETKDTTALSDSELAEMADLSAAASSGYEVGFLSKHREEWVLVTQAREDGRLVGYSFSTLERIGGTPSLLVGVASFVRGPAPVAESALKTVMGDLFRRAVLAFPDEDVLLGTRLASPAAFRAFAGLEEVVPRPEHKATGEERAWGRRLAKRFGVENSLDDRSFVITGDGSPAGLLDYDPQGPAAAAPAEVTALFATLDPSRHDSLVGFGWAMAEDLAEGSLPH